MPRVDRERSAVAVAGELFQPVERDDLAP